MSRVLATKGTPAEVSLSTREVLANAYPGVMTPPEPGSRSLSLRITMAACTMHSDVDPYARFLPDTLTVTSLSGSVNVARWQFNKTLKLGQLAKN